MPLVVDLAIIFWIMQTNGLPVYERDETDDVKSVHIFHPPLHIISFQFYDFKHSVILFF